MGRPGIPESNLVAVCDAREDVSKKIASKFDVKSYTDFHELVEDKDVEALTVAVPNFLHHDVAVVCGQSGKARCGGKAALRRFEGSRRDDQ